MDMRRLLSSPIPAPSVWYGWLMSLWGSCTRSRKTSISFHWVQWINIELLYWHFLLKLATLLRHNYYMRIIVVDRRRRWSTIRIFGFFWWDLMIYKNYFYRHLFLINLKWFLSHEFQRINTQQCSRAEIERMMMMMMMKWRLLNLFFFSVSLSVGQNSHH